MKSSLAKIWRGAVAAAALALVPMTGIGADFELRLGHVTSDKEPIQQAMEQFVAKVAERTDGRVDIAIFPNGILGTNPRSTSRCAPGAPVMTISDPGYLSDFVPDFGVLGGPYLMADRAISPRLSTPSSTRV